MANDDLPLEPPKRGYPEEQSSRGEPRLCLSTAGEENDPLAEAATVSEGERCGRT